MNLRISKRADAALDAIWHYIARNNPPAAFDTCADHRIIYEEHPP